ncbi:MAG: hypothetical protein ACRDKJ_01280, partial [Actinomycetota bacterium]
AGNLEGVATDPWTAKQVEARRGRKIPQLLAEWSEHADAIDPLLPSFPPELEQRDMALRVEAGDHRWETGDPKTTVTDPFELLRAYGGRRSPDQIRSWDWSGDPEPYLPLVSPFGLRADELVE